MTAIPGFLFLVPFMIASKAHWTTASNSTYFTCAFEHDDICGFEQLTDDDFDWTRHRGPTALGNTGPSADHTTGTGYYMYMEGFEKTGAITRLLSPFQNITDEDGMCLEFYYHMHRTPGTLRVYLFPGIHHSSDQIFTKSGDQGNLWRQKWVYFNPPRNQWRIIFYGQQGGNIAIDDVSFTQGQCPTEAPIDQYWTTTTASVPDVTPWGDVQGIRLTGGTYLAGRVEVLYNEEWGTVCSSYVWNGYDAEVTCRQLGFAYWSFSGVQASLVRSYDKGSGRIWMSGVKCRRHESSLSDCQHDGFGNNSCTHEHDVIVGCTEYPRPRDYSTCTFEYDTCDFYNMNYDDFDWTRHQGPTLSMDTGPSGDHTTGTGYYMYVETSSGSIGWETRLASPTYLGTESEGLCLNFYYHMYGSSLGTFNVIFTRSPGPLYQPTTSEVVFTASEDHGNSWRQASVHFSYPSQWGIIFEVIRGSSYTGDIAIDDVSFTPGPCPTQVPEETTAPMGTTESSTEDVVLRCSSSSYQVDIPKNLIEGTYLASDFYLSGDPDNPKCKGFYNGANYISLNSSLAECGTQYYENYTHLLYQNMVGINPSDSNNVVDFLGVEIPIICEYNSSVKVQTHFKTLNDVIRKKEKGSFDFDFAMYTDITYSTRYNSYPVETKVNEELYFRAELLRSANNLEIHLRSCRATPSPNYDDAVVYEFINAGCGINNAPVRILTPNKQTQADFEITSFRFRKDLSHPESQIWIHCEVVVCDINDANSECRQGCEQPRHRRSAESAPLKTRRMIQGPILLSSDDNGNSDTLGMSENNDGFVRVFTALLSALSLVMLVGLVAMGVILTKVIKSSKRQGYQPLPNQQM